MKQVELKQVKEGEVFRLSVNGAVYVRGYYERSCKMYECYQYDNVNHESFFKGSRKVYVEFEY